MALAGVPRRPAKAHTPPSRPATVTSGGRTPVASNRPGCGTRTNLSTLAGAARGERFSEGLRGGAPACTPRGVASRITIVGGGLAGCEAALLASSAGVAVRLVEQKPIKRSPAHKTDGLAE